MDTRVIRPPDPILDGMVPLRYMPVTNIEAVRWMLHLAFRDAHTALDLTFAHGAFWRDPLPPGLLLSTNTLDLSRPADFHRDFRNMQLADESVDVTIFDPPHIPNGGRTGIMARRYGTVKGTAALRELIEDGAREAWRIASVGVLVKVTDSANGGRHLQLSRWVEGMLPVAPYTELHRIGRHLRDGKHKAVRIPRSNGAVYLVFRKASHRHIDFDKLYRRQQARAARGAT